MDKIKVGWCAFVSAIFSVLGILAIPVFLLVSCNLIDYVTGIIASQYRNEKLSSYKGIKGIIKKVCQWLLIVVGAIIDTLINYAFDTAGIDFHIPFIVAMIVAVWLVINEILSILENMVDIGVDMPPFLMPIVKMIKKTTEDVAKVENDEEKKGEE